MIRQSFTMRCKKTVSLAAMVAFVGVVSSGAALASYDTGETNAKAKETSSNTTRTETNTTVRNLNTNISTSVRNVISKKINVTYNDPSDTDFEQSGVNAGDEPMKFLGVFENVWVSADHNWTETNPWGNKQLKTDADGYSFSVGMDTSINDQFIAGFAFSHGRSDADTQTNTNGQHIEQESSSFSLVPYGAYIINDNYYVSGFAGVSRADVRNHTISNAGAEVSRSAFRSTTYLASVEGNYLNTYGKVDFLGSAGLVYSNTKFPGYVSTGGTVTPKDTKVQRSMYMAVQASYPDFVEWEGLGLVPSARVAFEYDEGLSGIGNSALRTSAGVSKNINDTMDFSIEANHMLRSNQSESGIMMNLNVAF